MLGGLLLLVACWVVCADCFNFEVREPVVKIGPTGSYFGYSVAEHITDDDKKWLLVGAPVGQNAQPNTNRSGALYKCPPDTHIPTDCTEVITDGHRLEDFDYDDDSEATESEPNTLQPPGPDEIKNGQWLGVAVKSQKAGGKVVVCAHRYITAGSQSSLRETQLGLGLCYSLKSNLSYDGVHEPCRGRPMTSAHQEFGFCQAGTSLAFLEDGTAVIGSPGPYTWRGTIFTMDIVTDFLQKDNTVYLGPLGEENPIVKYSYLGMSVTAGRFFDKNVTTFVAGAPRGDHHGSVYFFTKIPSVSTMNVHLIINGTQIASNYGYEILAVDVNNDGYDDMFVAAPFYFDDKQNVGGTVYVYYNLRSCTKNDCKPDLELKGPAESRFGFAMTSLGDINKDGYKDVAIGAPYESNGAVYIYLGGPNGVSSTPSQKIQVSRGNTIGYSLSAGMDLDDNDYPDLLVGAYESDTVFLFKTKPIIDIHITIKDIDMKNINSSKHGCKDDPASSRTCFSYQACFKLSRPVKRSTPITVVSHIEADIKRSNGKFSRVFFDSIAMDRAYLVTHIKTQRSEHCQHVTVYIKENNRDILSPIWFRANYTLANNEVMAPILNQSSVKEFEATFQKDCGVDELCQSNLVLDAAIPALERVKGPKQVYSMDLGSSKEILVNLNVTNQGEAAYEAQLFVRHSRELSYIGLANNQVTNSKCSVHNNTFIACNLGNPFGANRATELNIRFDFSSEKSMLEFHAFVNSTSEEQSKQTSVKFYVQLKRRAEVKITGAATAFVMFGGPIKGEAAMKHFDDIGSRVWHSYQVSNDGPGAVKDLQVTIRWPMQVDNGGPQGKWLLYLEEMPMVEYNDNIMDTCTIKQPFVVNELNLTNRIGLVELPPSDLRMPPTNLNRTTSVVINSNNNVRRRRDIDNLVPEKLISDEGRRNAYVLDCSENGKAKCATITCIVPKLHTNKEALIKIKSRVWNSTLVEDFSNEGSVLIRSKASISIPDKSVEQNESDDKYEVETTAYPEVTQVVSVPVYYIILAVTIGILIFIIIVAVLYKLGFFKRKRINDPTLMGNLKKASESENLLK